MKNNVKVQDDTQSLQSCVSVSVMDFRIGNLIYSPIQKENVTLVAIEQGNRPITLGKRGTSSFSGFDCLQAILLTDKLLLKLGFIEVDYAGGCYQKKGITIDMADFNCCYKRDWLEIDVKCVHQLQNLYFALTGSELQISSITEH